MSNPDVFFGVDKVSIPDSYTQDHLHEFLQDLMYGMKDHVERNLSRPGKLRWCWIAEFYSDGKGIHIHGYFHDIPGVERPEVVRLMQAYIDLEDPNTGLPRARRVWHEPARIRNGMAGYILKGRKLREMHITPDEAREAMLTYRVLNGRGMVHTSRAGAKFYRNPETGEWITQTEARIIALEEWQQIQAEQRAEALERRRRLGYGTNTEFG